MYWSDMRIVLTHVSIVSGATSLLWMCPTYIRVHLTNVSIVLDDVNGSLLAQETSSVGAYVLYSSSGFLTVTNMSIMVQNSNLSISNFPLVGLLDGLSSISLTGFNVELNSSTVQSFVSTTLSVAYLCFVEGIVSRVSFIARNSSFVIAQEQLPSSLMIVNASVDTQLLHLEFAPMTISVSHLAASI
ncbi:transmembrane protein, putative, partial [Bodo saltans]